MDTRGKHIVVGKLEGRDGPLCHICELPMSFRYVSGGLDITASIDHLSPTRPRSNTIGGLKLAHRWCNSRRQHEPITPELVGVCQERIKPILEQYRKQSKFLKIKEVRK